MTDSEKFDLIFSKLEMILSKLEKLDSVSAKLDAIDKRTTNIELHIENVTDKNIQLIAENYIELTKKLNQAIPVADKNLAYEVKVNYLIEEVDKLKKEFAEMKSRIA